MARDLAGVLRVVAALQGAGLGWMASLRSRDAMVQAMMYYMVRLDIRADALPPIIHIAGTKGKGSTAAMCESMLRHSGLRTGLYTSPHLVSVCERYKINGVPVEEAAFLRQFWNAWDVLNASDQPICPPALAAEYGPAAMRDAAAALAAAASPVAAVATSSGSGSSSSGSGSDPAPPPAAPTPASPLAAAAAAAAATAPASVAVPRMPPLPGFNFLTLVAFKLFVEAGVDVLVLEVGLGGRLDATNVVPAPVVCGVTTLDFDHVELLGHTLAGIAAEKAGIFKGGVPAITAPQRADALARLAEVAGEVGAPLYMADAALVAARAPHGLPPRLGVDGAFQRTNAAVAVALTDVFMHQLAAGRVASSRLPRAAVDAVVATYRGSSSSGSSGSAPPAAAGGARRPSFSDTFGASCRLPAGTLPPPPYDAAAPLSPAVLAGLAATRWPGRAQVVHMDAATARVAAAASGAPTVALYLDGAHTERSIIEASRWFLSRCTAAAGATTAVAAAAAARPSRLVLVFNCGAEKDALQLLLPLSTLPFADVYFTTVPWMLSPRTEARNAGEALRSWIAKKRDMEDAAALADLRAGAEAAGAAWDDLVAGRGDAWTATPAPLPEDADPRATPKLLLWQRTLQSLHTAARSRPELAVLRARMAAAIGSSSGSSSGGGGGGDEPAYHVRPTVGDVLAHVAGRARLDAGTDYHVFVTGSLYLVGAALEAVGAAV